MFAWTPRYAVNVTNPMQSLSFPFIILFLVDFRFPLKVDHAQVFKDNNKVGPNIWWRRVWPPCSYWRSLWHRRRLISRVMSERKLIQNSKGQAKDDGLEDDVFLLSEEFANGFLVEPTAPGRWTLHNERPFWFEDLDMKPFFPRQLLQLWPFCTVSNMSSVSWSRVWTRSRGTGPH